MSANFKSLRQTAAHRIQCDETSNVYPSAKPLQKSLLFPAYKPNWLGVESASAARVQYLGVDRVRQDRGD